jgi:hypothetical protein
MPTKCSDALATACVAAGPLYLLGVLLVGMIVW